MRSVPVRSSGPTRGAALPSPCCAGTGRPHAHRRGDVRPPNRGFQPRVTALLQEYLHLVYFHVPQVRVWHFCLIPSETAIHLVAQRFRRANVLPCWTGLFESVLPVVGGVRPEGVPFETLESQAGRLIQDPQRHHMCSSEDPGPAVMWFGREAFFYVIEQRGSSVFTNSRPPRRHTDLPGWVMDLLAERVGGARTAAQLQRGVDEYLSLVVDADTSSLMRFLRCINWAALPLYWEPRYLKNVPFRVPVRESRNAHARLTQNILVIRRGSGPETDEDKTLRSEAVAWLADITGIQRE